MNQIRMNRLLQHPMQPNQLVLMPHLLQLKHQLHLHRQLHHLLIKLHPLLLMLPLAATSFNAAIRRLGAARWKMLHRAVYGVALLAILHFFWMRAGKQVFGTVAVYAAILAVLLGWRLISRVRRLRT